MELSTLLGRSPFGVGFLDFGFVIIEPVIVAGSKKGVLAFQVFALVETKYHRSSPFYFVKICRSSFNTSSLFSGETKREKDISFIFPT